MIKRIGTTNYKVNPVLEHALDVLFILHADHEQNCSHHRRARWWARSEVDPYSAVAAGIAALYGPLHGGANEAVLRMLREIGHVSKVPDFIKAVKGGEGETKLMGFGHRVYKSYDPRAKVIKRVADEVFEVTGKNPLLDIAAGAGAHRAAGRVLREAQALPERRLLLGPHLRGDGLPGGHVPGAVRHPAHRGLGAPSGRRWCTDPEQKIARPRQMFTGPKRARLRPHRQALTEGHDARLHLSEVRGHLRDRRPGSHRREREARAAPTATPARRPTSSDDFVAALTEMRAQVAALSKRFTALHHPGERGPRRAGRREDEDEDEDDDDEDDDDEDHDDDDEDEDDEDEEDLEDEDEALS